MYHYAHVLVHLIPVTVSAGVSLSSGFSVQLKPLSVSLYRWCFSDLSPGAYGAPA
jgi:hypothetical protein